MKQTNNDKTLIERISMVSRAAILTRHALTDLCADYLRVVATIHASELTEEQRRIIREVSDYMDMAAKCVEREIAKLDIFFKE